MEDEYGVSLSVQGQHRDLRYTSVDIMDLTMLILVGDHMLNLPSEHVQ